MSGGGRITASNQWGGQFWAGRGISNLHPEISCRIHRGHPISFGKLRATEVREQFGSEAAQVVLGHANAVITQIYAERNEALAAQVAMKIG